MTIEVKAEQQKIICSSYMEVSLFWERMHSEMFIYGSVPTCCATALFPVDQGSYLADTMLPPSATVLVHECVCMTACFVAR